MATKRISGRAWVQATLPCRLQWAQQGAPCALCGEPIDYTAHHSSAQALTVDHVVALMHGGPMLDPANWQPAHRSCNSRKGQRDGCAGPVVDVPALTSWRF